MSQKLFIGRKISAETKNWLILEKIRFEEHSFIQIELNEPDFSLFSYTENKPKHWVVSSQWAAKWLFKFQSEIGLKDNDSIFCLSEKQKEIFAGFAGNIFVANSQNAVSLAQLALEKNRGEQVLYLHGNLTPDVFELEMKSVGNSFQKAEVYRNLPVLKKLENKFGVYLFFSPSGAQNFYESGNQIPLLSAIAAIGSTTSKACEKIFGREICISEKQEELAAVKFAARLLKSAVIPATL